MEDNGHIDIDTKFIMLIGTPLTQSFAARMQNAAYKSAGMNTRYFYNDADSTHLKEILDGLRYTSSFAGAAVTRPNKVAVMEYLDALDPLCEKMGSCNTIVKGEDGKLTGYNTDGYGFLTSLVSEGAIDPSGETFFCIGAGGAGRAMSSALADAGAAKIYITDVRPESAAALERDINHHFAPVAEAVGFGDFSTLDECSVVMNASGIGMGSTVAMTPLPAELMNPNQFYFDACYNPKRTKFLLNAEAVGAPVLNGLGMSIFQGAKQINLWFNEDAPLDVMREALEAIIAEREATARLAEAPKATMEAVAAMKVNQNLV